MGEFLVYGSYGYTGELIAEAAAGRDLDFVVAGRREVPVREQAETLGCPGRAFSVEHEGAIADALEDVDVLLNCAGPFVETYQPLVEGAIDAGAHYLDITGEMDVFQGVAEYDDEAADADVMCMSGVGFDVVPTDCMAAHLADRLPGATHLALGFQALSSISKGTAKSAVNYLGESGLVRRDGLLEKVPPAHKTRRIDFGRGETTAATIPWADVITAYHTTGIPNVEVYMALPQPAIWAIRGSRPFAPLLGTDLATCTLQELAELTFTGPSERQRRENRSHVWGEATDDEGNRAVSRLETPETYALTVETAIEIAGRALDGDAPAGYQTPAGAYGADLVMAIEGVEREDVE
jgi:short subunit dehydrogenase-like uncharacterized protein